MIEIVSLVAGRVRDRAEAGTPEAAVRAAKVLLSEAADAGCASKLLLARFYVEGMMVREADIVGLGGVGSR